MPRLDPALSTAALPLVLAACLGTTALAEPSPADPFGKHHLSVVGGYARFIHRAVEHGAWIPEISVEAPDLQNGVDVGVRYRFSQRPGVDFAFELHRVEARGTATIRDWYLGTYERDRTRRTDWWGVGVRRTLLEPGFRPFFQATLVRVSQSDGVNPAVGSSLGVAFAAGGEVALGRSMSMPIELGWTYAEPYDDVSNLGLRAGLTWHPGR
jgi:hypothetical protein